MPRYIDADRIVFWIRHVSSNGKLCDTDVRKVAFSDEIARIPTADVVPKSEVEELKHIYKRYNKAIKHEREEVAREIFEEIEKLMFDGAVGGKFPAKVINPSKYAELKKKYTEGESNGSKQ